MTIKIETTTMNKKEIYIRKDIKGNKTLKFGEDVEGFNIPVLNEREIRAAAGLLFLIMFISILVVFFKGNFLMLKYAVTIFYKEKAQYCPGEVCDTKSRHDIQKTSGLQMLIILGFIAYIILTAFSFNDNFNKRPHELFGNKSQSQTK